MVDISLWMKQFLRALDSTFGARVWFVGLQGSYGRGEATEKSDIDVVVILDELQATDIRKYNTMLDDLAHRDKICGFLSGKDELLSWESSDLFQFYWDTTPIKGTLDSLLPMLDRAAVSRAAKIGVCSVYHGCVHNMLHGKSEDVLRGLYKMASFAVQAIAFLQTGKYYRCQTELIGIVRDEEKKIVENFLFLKNGGAVAFEKMSEQLFLWAQKQIKN